MVVPFSYAYDNWTSNSSLNDGLVGYWKLDETSGTNAVDFLGINNGTNFGANVGVAGKIGTAYNFSNAFINLSDTYNTQLETFTISAWIYKPWDSYYAYSGIVTKSLDGSTGWGLDEGGIGELGGRLCVLLGEEIDCNSVTGIYPIGFDNWIFVVYTYNGTDMQLWKNDTIIGTYTKTGLQMQNSESIKIGLNPVDLAYFIGSIDEVGIWNRSLSDAEILQLYNDYAGNSPQQIIIEEPAQSFNGTLISPNDNEGFTNPESCGGTICIPYPVEIKFVAYVYPNTTETNATFLIWNSSNNQLLIEATEFSTDITSEDYPPENITEYDLIVNSFASGNYEWNVYVCDLNNSCIYLSPSQNRTFFVVNRLTDDYNTSIRTTFDYAGRGLFLFIKNLAIPLLIFLVLIYFVIMIIIILKAFNSSLRSWFNRK